MTETNIALIVGIFTIAGIIFGIVEYKDRRKKSQIDDAVNEALESKEIAEIKNSLDDVCDRLNLVEKKAIATEIILETIKQIQDARDRLSKLEMKCNIYHREDK